MREDFARQLERASGLNKQLAKPIGVRINHDEVERLNINELPEFETVSMFDDRAGIDHPLNPEGRTRMEVEGNGKRRLNSCGCKV